MIAHLLGTLEQIEPQYVVLDVNNVGYKVTVPSAVLSRLPGLGEKVKLFTVQIVREDDISLYGFLNKEERSLFMLLLSVSGIGPKIALALISGFPLDRLVAAIAQADVALLSTISGVGRKTAERLVVELKEKISKAYAIRSSEFSTGIKGEATLVNDSISALISLGYSPKEARLTVSNLEVDKLGSVEEIIRSALRRLA
ncbi:Holliday junction DNA helicase RuvA [candidate division WOR-1 bacterium RIFOXYB2_FULL_48_7]|uniref:Holliday junction branch migration complex subunit RuvA n=1 Tax=candidate division WOR-1 bacterium RIFOXYB2_FULL_48_7 TaxID=1802583 RepID=A0A1F4TRW5_UNCSA|nr:MAG: Holliday junction DNA helicase RuvA [candidate division WOR-1 bacterium RIFOXYB2_FULL_48_7]